jgi:MFS family permease
MDPRVARARTLIRLFYWFQISVGLILWMPIFYHYQKQMGLNDAQILNIQSAYYFSFCLLEIPTGYLADRLGHLGCVRIGAALHVLTHALPIFWVTENGFLAHWLLLALSRSLISGAGSAYLYNQLEHLEQVDLYKEAEGKARAWSLAAKVLGFVLTDFLTRSAPSLPYLVSALSAMLATLIALRFPAPFSQETPDKPQASAPEIRRVLSLLWGAPLMQVVILQGIAIFTLTRIVQVNLFQPLLEKHGYAATTFGTILAVNTLFEAWASAYPHVLRRFCSDLAAVFWLTAGLALCCWGLAHSDSWGVLIWLNVFAVFTGLAYPIQRQVMNAHIPDSNYRASLLSAESLADRAVCAWVAHRLGAILLAGQMTFFLDASAYASLGGCVLLAPIYALLARRRAASASAAPPSTTPAP